MKAVSGQGCDVLPSLAPFTLLVLPRRPPPLLLIVVVVVLLPPQAVVLPHFVDAVAVLALVAFVAVAAKPLSQQLQVVLRVPPSDGKVPVIGESDAVAVSAQVEVMAGEGVPADAAAVPLAQEVATDLGSSRHVGDVPAQAVSQEGFHLGTVMLRKQNNTCKF